MYTPGSLPPMMYSEGGKKRQSPRRTSDSGSSAREAGPSALRSQAQPEAAGRGRDKREAQIGEEQALEAVAVRHGKSEHDRERDRDADDDCPEQPFLGVEPRAPVAIGDRQAEDHRSGQPADDEEFDERQASGDRSDARCEVPAS